MTQPDLVDSVAEQYADALADALSDYNLSTAFLEADALYDRLVTQEASLPYEAAQYLVRSLRDALRPFHDTTFRP